VYYREPRPRRGNRDVHANGGAVGGIPPQIEDGVTGYLVDSAAQCAERGPCKT